MVTGAAGTHPTPVTGSQEWAGQLESSCIANRDSARCVEVVRGPVSGSDLECGASCQRLYSGFGV